MGYKKKFYLKKLVIITFKEPTPGKESEQPGCDLCMQNFESGPEPGHLSVRRACVDRLWVHYSFI